MKLNIEVEIPDNEFENSKLNPLYPFNVEVSLDYGDKVLYTHGNVKYKIKNDEF